MYYISKLNPVLFEIMWQYLKLVFHAWEVITLSAGRWVIWILVKLCCSGMRLCSVVSSNNAFWSLWEVSNDVLPGKKDDSYARKLRGSVRHLVGGIGSLPTSNRLTMVPKPQMTWGNGDRTVWALEGGWLYGVLPNSGGAEGDHRLLLPSLSPSRLAACIPGFGPARGNLR